MDVDFINSQLVKIVLILNNLLVPDEVNAIYDYRTMPSKLPFVISVSYLGGLPGSGTTGGFDSFSDFALVVEAHHDKTADRLKWSESQMNKVEALIVASFNGDNYAVDGFWMSAEFYKPSTRPPSPSNYPDTRLGQIYLRVNS